MKYSVKTEGIVCKRVPAPHPLWSQPPLDPVWSPFLKSLLLLCSFVFHLLSHFTQTPHPHATPSRPSPTNQPSFGSNKYQKGDFTSSIVVFCQKLIFNLLNPFTNRDINLNLYGIFLRSSSDNFEWLFFHKIMVA